MNRLTQFSLALVTMAAVAVKSPVCADSGVGPDDATVSSLETGKSLPVLEIKAGGEIEIVEKDYVQLPWSSRSLEGNGKVQLIQYVAGNLGAARQNKPFNDSIKERRFTADQLTTTIIVQMADTKPFMKGLVVNRMAKNKARHETINFVVDDQGMGIQRWGMKHKSFAIIVLDASGKVLFFKDGPLTENEVEYTIELMENHMS